MFRRTKKTVFIVGEGPTEQAFLQFLKDIYITRDGSIDIKIECGSGGSPKSIIQKTIRLSSNVQYDRRYVLIDNDKPVELDKKIIKLMNKKPPIKILKSTPCIEGLLLTILDHKNFSQSDKSSNFCKREFESHYISADKKTNKHVYEKLFERTKLEKRRKYVSELDAILKAMGVG